MKKHVKLIGVIGSLASIAGLFIAFSSLEATNNTTTLNGDNGNIVQNNSGQITINQNTAISDHRGLPIKIRAGLNYVNAKEQLINDGWQPVNRHLLPNLIPVCWDYYWKGPRKCNFPEVQNCSGTGMGFCLMYFYDSFNKTYLRVRTKGGSPPKYAMIDLWVIEEKIEPAEYHNKTIAKELLEEFGS